MLVVPGMTTNRRSQHRGASFMDTDDAIAPPPARPPPSHPLQVRSGRPVREMTMDDVEKSLLKQQGLLGSFAERVNRAIAQVDKEVAALESVRAKLEADLRDKVGSWMGGGKM